MSEKEAKILEAARTICIDCECTAQMSCELCPVSKTARKYREFQPVRGEYNRGHTRGLLDVKDYLTKHEFDIKASKLNTFKGVLKVIDALIENREELRSTGTVKLKSTPDKRLVSARKVG